LQEAFIAEQVPQCGFCINGWVMTAAAFLEKTPKPTEAQMKEALSGIKCRCGTHMAILRAVMRVAQA
jgi:nicotinate dehydrogenase subunit A